MTFELWDTITQNIIGAYDTKDDALAVVAAAVRAYGPAYADTIALVHDLDRRAEVPIPPS